MALNPIWTVYDPLADCSIDAISGVLNISIPSGTTHDLWTANKNAPRVTQVSLDSNFIVDIKVDSTPIADSAVGLVAVQDNNNMVRFGFQYNAGNLRMFGAEIISGTGNNLVDVSIAMPTFPFYARLRRTGDDFECFSSPDGVTWTKRGSTMTVSLTVAQVGMFAATAGTNPAWTALIDEFIVDNVSPIVETVDFLSSITVLDSFSALVDLSDDFSSSVNTSGLFDAETLSDSPIEDDFLSSLLMSSLFDASVIELIDRPWIIQSESSDEWAIQPEATDLTET